MLFSKLKELSYDKDSDRINVESIVEILPVCPIEIINDIYADHGRKAEFQAEYGNVDISKLHWKLMEFTGKELIESSIIPEFLQWVLTCKKKLNDFNTDGWECISNIKTIEDSWNTNKTWLKPPYFFDPNVLAISKNNLHLVEGHTRLGILMGLINKKIVSPTMTHKVWLGKINGNY